jgi:hypothetical protein
MLAGRRYGLAGVLPWSCGGLSTYQHTQLHINYVRDLGTLRTERGGYIANRPAIGSPSLVDIWLRACWFCMMYGCAM